jgi:zinc protease
MKTRLFALVAATLLPVMAFPQVRPRTSPQTTPPPAYMQQLKSYDQEGAVTKVVLKNNLTVLVAESHASPLVEVLTWIKAGYGTDPQDQVGISRIAEHMLLRGTTNRSAAVIASDMKALGGEIQSGAEYDHAYVRNTAPAAQWKKLLEIQADLLLNPLFDSQELKRQIDFVADEGRSELENPATLLRFKLLSTGIAGERMKRVPTSSQEVLGRITREKLLAYYKSVYTSDRILLVVCGDVSAVDVLNSIVNLYAGIRSGAAADSAPAIAGSNAGFRYVQVRGADPLGRLVLGFRAVPETGADYPALQVLRAILGTGESSTLNRRLKNQKRLILRSNANLYASGDSGFLSLEMESDPKDLDRSQIAAFTEFEILKHQDESDGELERARSQLRREFWEVTQTVSGRAERIARLEFLGSWKAINGYLARLDQVKWADVTRVAARYLTLENCAMAEYVPAQSAARDVTGEMIQNTLKGLLTASVQQEVAEREKEAIPALEIPEDRGPFVPSPVRYSFQKASILRGPELIIREDHTMPVIHLGLFWAGGKLLESKTNSGITSLMLRTMLRDSKTRSADQLYRQLEVYGGILTPVLEDDYYGVHLSILSENVEAGLDLLSEMIKSPKLDPEEIARQKVLQAADSRRRSNDELGRRLLYGALFQDYSYAFDGYGTEDSVASLTADAIQAWYKLNVADKKPMVVIIGDTQGSSLAGYFVRNFSGSRFQDVALPEKFAKPLEKRVVVEGSATDSTSRVLVGFQAPPVGDEDSFPLAVFQKYASGLAGRLTTSIMDRIPSSRRATVEYEPHLRGGSIAICVSAAPSEEELAVTVVQEELQKVLAAQLSYRDYRSAMNMALAGIQLEQQSHFRQISEVIGSLLSGKGLEGFQEFGDRLQDVKQADLQEVAQRVFKIGKSVILRVHGKSQQ